ncbi:MAG: tetrahydromethanopterin S-methyltransferase subunit A [Methanosarcinales archaeon]|nr:tetrahydromethanopterin S-methyltransferase subunit A [Methanosarcinales archaeon]
MTGLANPWPVSKGDFRIGDATSCVCVVTLASEVTPSDDVLGNVALWGTCKTENLGMEKIIVNVISNCNIRYVIIAGQESRGHFPGDTMFALYENGIDENGRIIGSNGAIPFIENISEDGIARFVRQVQLIDMRDIYDLGEIGTMVDECKSKASREPFSEEPMVVGTKKKIKKHVQLQDMTADILITDGIVMDVVSGMVFSQA